MWMLAVWECENKIIPGMLTHNGTEPDLIAEDYRFTVRLWKDPKPS